MKPLIVDALASGKGKKKSTLDVIGAGPRTIGGVLEKKRLKPTIALSESVIRGNVDLDVFDLLLVSGMSSDIKAIRKVTSKWRSRSNRPVLAGGPIASESGKLLSKSHVDIAVIGEGELTLIKLLKTSLAGGSLPSQEELAKIKGISYLDNGAFRLNELRPVMKRRVYDEMPPSTRLIIDYPLHNSSRVYVEVLRGCSNYYRAKIGGQKERCTGCDLCRNGSLEKRYDCPYGVPPGCGYCSVPSLYGPPKSRSVNKILEETKELLSAGVRRIVLSAPDFLDYGRDLLVDPKPLTDPRHPEPNYPVIEELLSQLSEIDIIVEGEASFMIENIKGCLATKKVIEIIGKYLSGTSVNVGFETGSRKHCVELGRPSTLEENLEAVRRLRRVGLKPYTYFIHGLPGQTPETVKETVKAIDRSIDNGASRIIMYRFHPLPMSAFRDQAIAPPAAKNPLSKKMYDAAYRANLKLKKQLIGHRFKAVLAEPYKKNRKFFVAYPMLHGPVVLVEREGCKAGEIIDIEVENIISDRLVKGRRSYGIF